MLFRSHGLSDLELAITELCKKTKFRYGYRKIHQLINKDFSVSKNTVQKYMQKHNLQCRVKVKKYRKTGEPIVTAENIINRDFTATRPFEKLVTDLWESGVPPLLVFYHEIGHVLYTTNEVTTWANSLTPALFNLFNWLEDFYIEDKLMKE